MPDWQLHVILLAALLTANCSLASSPSVPPSTKPESTVQLMRQTSNDTSWQLNELASWRSRRSSSSSVELEPSEGQLESSGDNLRYSSSVTVILSVAYTMIFVVGIVGNSLVVAIVCKSPRMRTVTNYFIVNLAFADILVLLFCLPATLIGNLFIPYILGLFVCKTVSYLQGVAVSASINTMVAVTMDRFLAICFPLDWHMSRRTVRWTIACIWLFSLCISLPWALYFTIVHYEIWNNSTKNWQVVQVCEEVWPSKRMGNIYFVCANLILLYLLPATLIILSYLGIWYKIKRRAIPGDWPQGVRIELIMQKSKLKVFKMMMVVVVIFLLSWLPLYLIFARIKLATKLGSMEEKIINILMPLAQWLGASNSCINPILYTFFNRKYKRGFVGFLSYAFCCQPIKDDAELAASSAPRISESKIGPNRSNGQSMLLNSLVVAGDSSSELATTHKRRPEEQDANLLTFSTSFNGANHYDSHQANSRQQDQSELPNKRLLIAKGSAISASAAKSANIGDTPNEMMQSSQIGQLSGPQMSDSLMLESHSSSRRPRRRKSEQHGKAARSSCLDVANCHSECKLIHKRPQQTGGQAKVHLSAANSRRLPRLSWPLGESDKSQQEESRQGSQMNATQT